MDALEKAALDGSLFAGPAPPSPTRSASTTSPDNTDDELGSDVDLSDDERGNEKTYIGKPHNSVAASEAQTIQPPLEHRGPQTGVKGVIHDQRADASHKRAAKQAEATSHAVELQRKAMVGLTVHEEAELVAKEKLDQEDTELQELRRKRRAQLQKERLSQKEDPAQWDKQRLEDFGYGEKDAERGVRRGALREIGKENFVEAVEKEGWAIVLIYEPGLPRCNALSASLLHLSLNLPINMSISLYRARASALSFYLLPASSSNAPISTGDDHEEFDEDGLLRGKPDPDVLPTLLAYRNGELEKTWIRVDWNVGEDGVEGLLRKEGILPTISQLGINRQAYSAESDDDDE